MTRSIACIAAALLWAGYATAAYAQAIAAPVASPANHPLLAGHTHRTPAVWRQGIGQFGENLSSGFLRLRGYEVVDIKLPGNRGIDLVALKRDPTGNLVDIRLVEVKTHYGNTNPKLAQTRAGTQMSRRWLAHRLRALRASGEPGKRIALEISRFRKANGMPLEQLGEVHDINLRTGRYTIRNPLTMAERAGPMSIKRILRRVHSRLPESTWRTWAMSHLTQFDQIRRARMPGWINHSRSSSALVRVSSTKIAALARNQAMRGSSRALARAGSRIALFAFIAIECYDIYRHLRDYRAGLLPQREFTVMVARNAGEIAGAWAGAKAGAVIGMRIGALGGPYIWITVPVGTAVGTAVGAIGGYWIGSYVADVATHAWYNSLDKNVRDQVSQWLKHTPTPIGI